MKRVVIESPGAMETASSAGRSAPEARFYARLAMLDCARRGEAPLVRWMLADQIPVDVDSAYFRAGVWAAAADRTAAYLDLGLPSEMESALARVGWCVDLRRLPDDLWRQFVERFPGAERQATAFGPPPEKK